MEDNYLRTGVITNVHGLDGRMKIYLITDNTERFKPGNFIYINDLSIYKKYKVTEFIETKNRTGIIRLDGINDYDEALLFKKKEIYIDKKTVEETKKNLDPDSFYYYEIIGCKVELKGKIYGTVTEITDSGAGSLLIIKDKNEKEHMVPFVDHMVGTDRIKEGIIDIHPVEGLLDF
jgi:16S rRNA processing protein RimM